MKRAALLGLLIAITVVSDALALSKNDEVARDAAVQWLQLIDAGRYEEAASQGSQEVRAFEQWLSHFKTQRAPLGRMSNRQLLDLKRTAIVSGVPEVRSYYTVQFKTAFEHPPSSTSGVASKSVATEKITIARLGCCWEVFGYSITEVASDQPSLKLPSTLKLRRDKTAWQAGDE